MITFTLWRSGQQYRGFSSKGHAGYADEGMDVVCAAVSALVINTVNAVEAFTEDPFEVEQAEDGGFLQLTFPEAPGERAALLMDSLVLGMQQIEAEYGNQFVTLVYEEV